MTAASAQTRWLAIVGLGEDGVEGLSPPARALISAAGLVFGGARHLKLAAGLIKGESRAWPRPLAGAVPEILARRGSATAVLASGDPYCYGVGALLSRHVPASEIMCVPAPSAFALACARLGWSLDDTATLSCCGRPIEAVAPLLQPGRRVLVLSEDETTPAALAAFLRGRGFGPSRLHVLEALGGPREKMRAAAAGDFSLTDIARLNLVGIAVAASPEARVISLAAGLPDEFFENDGQLTKREIRAATLSALAPRAGEMLLDIGCGSGSISIEWLLAHPANRAIAIEHRPDRAARAARNAMALGVPRLQIMTGEAPAALDGVAAPDAVFIGGGAHAPGVIERAWVLLRGGGRITINAVTLETEAAVIAAHDRYGGALTRLSIERLDRIGRRHGFRPALTVTQWSAVKP